MCDASDQPYGCSGSTVKAGKKQIHHFWIRGVFILIPSPTCPLQSLGRRQILILTACVHPCPPVYAQGEGEIITLFSLGGNRLCLETFEHPIKLISFANESDDTEHFKVKFRWAFHLAGLWGNASSTAFVNQVPGVRILC